MLKINVQDGQLTLGQRIQLGKILTADIEDYEKFKNVLKCLEGPNYVVKFSKEEFTYYTEVLKGLQFWIKKEREDLKPSYDADELQAGVKDLSNKFGYFLTVKSVAKTFNVDPDTVLGWKYGKVFIIIHSDLEEHKYRKRLMKIKEAKQKGKNRKR